MSKIEKIFYDIQYNVFDKSVTFSEYKQNSIQPDQNFSDTLWYQHYSKAIEIGKKNLIFGSGIKSFREACKNPEYNIYLNKELPNDYGCATHPHNIYIEIFSETGILGFIFLVLVVCNLIYRINSINRHLIKILLFSSIIVLFFPFQTTGSFFSTFNGVFYFINISIYLYFSSNQKYLKKSLKL